MSAAPLPEPVQFSINSPLGIVHEPFTRHQTPKASEFLLAYAITCFGIMTLILTASKNAWGLLTGPLTGFMIMQLIRRWIRRHTSERWYRLISSGHIPEWLANKTHGSAYSYRVVLCVETYNQLVRRYLEYERACQLGVSVRRKNDAAILERLRYVHERLTRAVALAELMHDAQASEAARRQAPQAILEALTLHETSDQLRIFVDSRFLAIEPATARALTDLEDALPGPTNSNRP